MRLHDRRADAVSSERKEIVFCIGYLFCLQQMVRKRIKNAYLQGLQTKRPRQNSTEKKTDKPYVELQKMVGLSDVKEKVTDEILAAAKMQKMRKQMGLPGFQSSMHMLFSGNPGTAKTTVARLLSQVLKEGRMLSGHIVECGRQDLVGKYVDWTGTDC